MYLGYCNAQTEPPSITQCDDIPYLRSQCQINSISHLQRHSAKSIQYHTYSNFLIFFSLALELPSSSLHQYLVMLWMCWWCSEPVSQTHTNLSRTTTLLTTPTPPTTTVSPTSHQYDYSQMGQNPNQPTNQPTNQPNNQPNNQTNKSTKQSINQPTDQPNNLPCAGSRTFHVSRCGTAGARPPPGSVGSTREGGGRSHYLAHSATHTFVTTVYALLATELPRGRGDVRLPFPGCYERAEVSRLLDQSE